MGYIERSRNGGDDSRGCCTPGYFFHLFRVLSVLHCLYNLKKSNLKCVTSKVLWQLVNWLHIPYFQDVILQVAVTYSQTIYLNLVL